MANSASQPHGGDGASHTDELGSEPATAALAELVAIVDRLRDPEGGCPWDLEQTHRSLIPYVLEEAHEVADAIRQGDPEDLQDELGDLLLQVVLHARIASEAGQFDLAAIARGISAKLVRRHPHVFAAAEAAGSSTAIAADSATDIEAVRRNWEAIKAEERAERRRRGSPTTAVNQAHQGLKTKAALNQVDSASKGARGESMSPLSDRLADKARSLPALAGAMAISRQAAAAGFEWDDLDGVWAKVHEELDELKEAVALAWAEGGMAASGPGRAPANSDSAARDHAETELGDVLFTLVNVARWCRLDPEEGLAGTNRRFLDRFSRLEAALDGDLGGRNIQELEALWQQAKAAIRAEQVQRAEL